MSAGTGARGPRRHASSSAALCTADVATPAVVPRPSSSRSARAPSSPPILASAVTASVWGGPCEVAGTERTSASRGATARDSFSRPSPKAAAAATPWFESPSASTRASTAAGSPIRPAASAAWRRTTGSGCRSASPNSAGSKARASAAARTRASSLTSASSGCCAAAPRPPSAAAPSRTTTLQANRIRDRLEEGEYMPGDSRHGVLMRQRDQRRLARGEQFAALGLVHCVTEAHTSRCEVAHPAAYPHEVVVPRGRAVAQLHLGDGEVDALPLELLVRQARFAHQLGAGPVEPDEVIGVVDDAHLGQVAPAVEAAFHRFLEAVPDLGDALLINGDLFDFWFEYGAVIPRRHFPSVAQLAALRRRGIPITFVGGNHDRWGGDFLVNDVGIAFYAGEAEVELAGRRAYVAHGDGLTEQHWSAKLMHRVTRHPFTIRAFRALHPDLGFWIAHKLSGRLADNTRDRAVLDRAALAQTRYAKDLLARRPDLGLVILAHTHRPALEQLGDGRAYLNPGAFLDGYKYAVVTPHDVELKTFE